MVKMNNWFRDFDPFTRRQVLHPVRMPDPRRLRKELEERLYLAGLLGVGRIKGLDVPGVILDQK